MTLHTIWPVHIQIEDNFLPVNEFNSLREYIISEYNTQNQYPLLSFDHNNLNEKVNIFKQAMMVAFYNYALCADLDPTMFELNNFQTHYITTYNEQFANEHIMEPHHDLAESGYIGIVYYLNFDETPGKFVGGDLTIYKGLTSVEYPEGIVHIKPQKNRLVIFPAFLHHRIKPYFSDEPRITIATLLRKERSYNQNKKIRVL